MDSKIFCPSCSAEVSPGDKFCRVCGTQLNWTIQPAAPPPAPEIPSQKTASDTKGVTCRLCGHQNKPGSRYCESCGNVVGSAEMMKEQPAKVEVSAAPTAKSAPLKALQSWKLTLGIGIVLVIVLVIIQSTKNKPVTPQEAAVQQQEAALPDTVRMVLEALQDSVTQHPNDMQKLLEYANALQDAKQYLLAVDEYQKYIKVNPNNPDAQVDLGVTYFEASQLDSTKHHQYLELADAAMHEAININPKHQLAYFNLGIVHLHMGEMDVALDWFKKCAAIDTTTATGRRAQTLIQQHTFTNPS